MEYWREWNVSSIIAKKLNKKTTREYKKLEKCVTTDGAETLTRYSWSVIDPVLNGFVNGKSLIAIVAAEIWHQRTCMQDLYAKPPEEANGFLKENDEVFQCMPKYIQINVINNGQL